MAKQKKAENSILLRSAETLGRVIGTLHRQLNGAAKILSETADDANEARPVTAPKVARTRTRVRKMARPPKAVAARKTTPGRKAAGARKAARARKATRPR